MTSGQASEKAQLPAIMCRAFGDITEFKLDEMERYRDSVEDFLDSEADEIREKAQQAVDSAPDQTADEIADIHRYRIEQMEEVFPSLLRESVFVTLYALLESELNQLCYLFDKHANHAMELEDVSGSGIFRAKKYLIKVAGMDFPSRNPDWGDIRNYNRIRNCIMHSQGSIREASNKLNNYIYNHSELSTDDHGNIEMKKRFVSKAIGNIKELFKEISEELQDNHSNSAWSSI